MLRENDVNDNTCIDAVVFSGYLIIAWKEVVFCVDRMYNDDNTALRDNSKNAKMTVIKCSHRCAISTVLQTSCI